MRRSMRWNARGWSRRWRNRLWSRFRAKRRRSWRVVNFPSRLQQNSSGGGGGGGNGGGITVEFKPFGVSLAFTPTVLADGVINLQVEPEVSSIDPSASITVNGLTVPGLQTRRAKRPCLNCATANPLRWPG